MEGYDGFLGWRRHLALIRILNGEFDGHTLYSERQELLLG